MIGVALLLVILGALMQAARAFVPESADTPQPLLGTTLAFGFLLLFVLHAGKLFARLRLPRLTGYLAAGIVTGPAVLELVTRDMVATLAPVKGVAICLIAFAAGGELNVRRMKPLLRVIGAMTATTVIMTTAACGAVVFALRAWLPFMAELDALQAAAVSAVLGVAISAMSPAVAMALLSELEAEGPVSRTVLGVVVAADLAAITLFAILSSGAQAVLGGSADVLTTVKHLGWELFGSAGAGVIIGLLLSLYLRKTSGNRPLFVLLVCIVMSEIGSRLAFDPLLIALSAGFFMENVVEVETSKLVHEIEAASLPVYVVFFALAGASLRLNLLAVVAAPALSLIVTRALAIWASARLAAKWAGADANVQRWAFSGFLPQAGLALAIALLLPKVFPSFGAEAATLVIGIVGINELLMPIVMRWGRVRAGEAGMAASKVTAQAAPAEAEQAA
jgi:Kef-type K+ transport system membrane component KefB